MKIFFAGPVAGWELILQYRPPYLLESFYTLSRSRKRQYYIDTMLQNTKIFLLDSGAFTFMNTLTDITEKELDYFVEDYAKFIVDNDIQLFFEMDVDAVLGYEKVLEYREFLEKTTKKKCIPVWHRSRGYEEWKKMLNSGYKIVAIGGFVIKEIKLPKELPYVNTLIKQAHRKNILVHGLGVSGFSYLNKTLFDSVDSTSWVQAPAYGRIAFIDINRKTIISKSKHEVVGGNKRGIHSKLRRLTLKKWLYVVKQFDNEEWDFLKTYNKEVE